MKQSGKKQASFKQMPSSTNEGPGCRDCRLQSGLKELDKLKEIESMKAGYERIISSMQEKIASLESMDREKDEAIFSLKAQLEYLKHRLWGKSSERFVKDESQTCIPFEWDDMEITEAEKQQAEEASQEIESYREQAKKMRKKSKPVRNPLPEHLPRKEEHIYPDINDRDKYDELPSEITEVLEREPGKFYVRRIIRHKYVLKTSADKETNETSVVITAPMPSLPIARSYAGASLLAELIVDKYVYHLPFYRQLEMFKHEGMKLPASTINDWFKGTADLLRPMYYRLQDIILQSDYIQVDETTIPVVIREEKKTVKSYIWLLRSVMDSLVFFHYHKGSRAREAIAPLLLNYQGALQTDGYEAYSIYDNKENIVTLGCWAHAGRYFSESINTDKARAEYALTQIGLLYSVERKADTDLLSYEERAALRTRLSVPIMEAFKKWLPAEYPKVLPKSPTGKAIKYAHDHYPRLKRYTTNGKYLIDNNMVENSVRSVALGRKNYLFCGNHSAAEDAAVIYSMMGCCKAHNVNFRQWLEYVLNNIHSYDNDYSRDLAELLPHNWKP